MIKSQFKINCYGAFEQGLTVMKKTDGQNLRELKLSRKDKINPLLAKNSKIKIREDVITVEPLLLFQRICVLKKTDEELQNHMNYELVPYPLCLFDDGELRKTKKSTFHELFPEISINLKSVEYVCSLYYGWMHAITSLQIYMPIE
ncbi:uncharacterized protein TNCV_1251501 [Trichonephila clavipes]|nr:uncharacterized protein TNCV_1251501 [Trichonephila clavipes]